MLLSVAFLAYKRSQPDLNSHHSRNSNTNLPNFDSLTSNINSTSTVDALRSVHKATIGQCFAPTTATTATTTTTSNSSTSFDNSSSDNNGEKQQQKTSSSFKIMEEDEIRRQKDEDIGDDDEHDHQQQHQHQSLVSVSSFRNDVRNEWIQALFGDSLYDDDSVDSNVKIGFANIAPYRAYSLKLKSPSSTPSPAPAPGSASASFTSVSGAENGNEKTTTTTKLGITINRLTLGLYVRKIQPGSEAACAGIQPNSILISINGLALLSEPSKSALERLWQYEGYDPYWDYTTKNSNNAATPQASMEDVTISDPVELVLMKDRILYTVVLLSNPPFGIDWGPCGNFALVKKNLFYSQNHIPVGSIIAQVGNIRLEDDLDHIRCAEEIRKFTTGNTDSDNEISIRVCFPPPQTRCGYHERRLQQSNNSKANDHPQSSPSAAIITVTPTSSRVQQVTSSTATLEENGLLLHYPRKSKKKQRPDAIAQHDGVEVRIHPIWNPCFSVNDVDDDTLHPNPRQQNNATAAAGYLSKLAYRVASGEIYSFSSSSDLFRRRRQQQRRRRRQRPPPGPSTSTNPSSFANSTNSNATRRMIRPCPPLQSPILDIWTIDDALLYLLQYHQIDYDAIAGSDAAGNNSTASAAEETAISALLFVKTPRILDEGGVAAYISRLRRKTDTASTPTTPTIMTGMTKMKNRATEQIYLMQILNFFCRQQQQHHVDLFNLLCCEDDVKGLCHHYFYKMEFLAQVLNLTELQQKLRLRRESSIRGEGEERGLSCRSTNLVVPNREITETVVASVAKSPASSIIVSNDHNNNHGEALLQPQHDHQHPSSPAVSNDGSPATTTQSTASCSSSGTHLPASHSAAAAALPDPAADNTSSKTNKKEKKSSSRRRLFSFLRKRSSKKSSKRKKLAAITNTKASVDREGTEKAEQRRDIEWPAPEKAPSNDDQDNYDNDRQIAPFPPKSPRRKQHQQPKEKQRSLIPCPPVTPRNMNNESSNDNSGNSNIMFSNTLSFLNELVTVCEDIEKSLLSLSLTQKIASWALQPWSASKETVLAQVTHAMRQRLKKYTKLPLLDPIDFVHKLNALDVQRCYILPSAHFPLLLTFDVDAAMTKEELEKEGRAMFAKDGEARTVFGPEKLYRTTVELVQISAGESSSFSVGDNPQQQSRTTPSAKGLRYLLHASVAGTVQESSLSTRTNRPGSQIIQVWNTCDVFSFDCRSSWGPPQTLSMSLSEVDSALDEDVNDNELDKDPRTTITAPLDGKKRNGTESMPNHQSHVVGFCFVDLDPIWKRNQRQNTSANDIASSETHQVDVWNSCFEFDEHGEIADGCLNHPEGLKLEVRVRTEVVDDSSTFRPRRSVLYKHDDDVRQEMVATEFVRSCDDILKASGLDLHLLTFRSIPVGKQRGFIEWVPGSIPLSEICQVPFSGGGSAGIRPAPRKPNSKTSSSNNGGDNDTNKNKSNGSSSEDDPHSSVAKAGLFKYESIHRVGSSDPARGRAVDGSSSSSLRRQNNPIQSYLRTFAFDEKDPYMIRKSVMERYVKSCAGYCVITYLLGVGDRHLDNLLLHPSGHFFHCDYSFILGNDPKKYQPLRMTQDMVDAMGGPDSDNFALFMSSLCAAFLTFRRPENVRHILSFVRVMEGFGLPEGNEIEGTKPLSTMEECLMDIRQRLRLDLSEEEAISYMEDLIHESRSSKLWIAVDAMHSLGKRF